MESKTLSNKKLIHEFVKFVAKQLQLKSLPANIKLVGSDYAKENLTFGTYNLQNDEIVVVNHNRHIADVMRTLAHELVHHKQREGKSHIDGSDGSSIENEANAMAGELLRKFRYIRPDIYSWSTTVGSNDELNEGGYIPVSDFPPASNDTTPTISNDPNLVTFDEDYSVKQSKILNIAKHKHPEVIDGTLVDVYTAALLIKILHKLSPSNRKKMLALPIQKMVATAYKLVTR